MLLFNVMLLFVVNYKQTIVYLGWLKKKWKLQRLYRQLKRKREGRLLIEEAVQPPVMPPDLQAAVPPPTLEVVPATVLSASNLSESVPSVTPVPHNIQPANIPPAPFVVRTMSAFSPDVTAPMPVVSVISIKLVGMMIVTL